MEFLHNGFTLELCPGSFPLTTDSIALASFAKLPRNARVLDLGSGCGTLGMLLCSRHDDCSVVGVELDEAAHAAAIGNAAANSVTDRYSSICADMNQIEALVKPGFFHVCVSNPPYFTAGPASKKAPAARQELCCSMDTLFRAAAWGLRWGGDLFLVHRPERLAELCVCATGHGLEPKRLRLVRHKPDSPVSVVLLQCRKGAKPGLIWEEESLYMQDGSPSPYFRSLYHLQEV